MPLPPSPQWVHLKASTPWLLQYSRTASISASVSEMKWLIATAIGTPNFFTFSMWRPRLARPFFSASTFSFLRSSFATPPCIFSARTVATMTVAAGVSPALRHLMSKNFSAPRSAPKTGLGHDIIGELQRRLGGHHRVAAMGDVGEGAAVHEGRIVFQRLHQVGHQRVLEQHGHGARRLDVLGQHLALVALGRHHDLAHAALEILDRGRQAEDGHDLGGHRDVEARLAREAVGHAAQRADDLAQRPVVHVHHARQATRRVSMPSSLPQ